MSKAEKFIQDYTRDYSNEVGGWIDGKYSSFYQPWLTPDQARKAVEIAREEMIEENKHEKSWRLDEKLWAGIKDVEEASYQYTYDASNDWAYDVPTWDDVQNAFKAGSEWKEGLELTWEDIESIHTLMAHQEVAPILWKCGNEAFYQEVLKRFKDYKERR